MRWILILFLYCYTYTASAQEPLSETATSSHVQALYRISNAEALKIFKSSIEYPRASKYIKGATEQIEFNADTSLLHTLVGVFPITEPLPANIPAGHYITVSAAGTLVHYRYITINTIHLSLLDNNRGLLLTVTDKAGNNIPDAHVKLENKNIRYSRSTQCYLLPQSDRQGIITVSYQGVDNFMHVFPEYFAKGYEGRPSPFATFWKRTRRVLSPKRIAKKAMLSLKPYTHFYHAYMALSKPKYKPGDTVKLKTFAVNDKGEPVNEPLQVRVAQWYGKLDTIIATIRPYRPGGYEYSFPLNASLRMLRDREVSIQLERTTEGRETIADKKFIYGEYELKDILFQVRRNQEPTDYAKGQSIKLFIKGTDNNDLPLLDARVKISITTESSDSYRPGMTFVPYKLMEETIPLETIGETVFNIPDYIFPDAGIQFTVTCQLLTSDNSEKKETFTLHRSNNPGRFEFDVRKDEVFISYFEGDTPKSVPGALLIHSAVNDSPMVKNVIFPCKTTIHPWMTMVSARTADISNDYAIDGHPDQVDVSGILTNHHLHILLHNPRNIPVRYQLIKEKRIIEKGFGTTFDRHLRANGRKGYKLNLQYTYGGNTRSKEYNFLKTTHDLQVNIDAPPVIQPGGKTRITVNVTNHNQKPVKDADVTAFAITTKFGDGMPKLPSWPYRNKNLSAYYPSYMLSGTRTTQQDAMLDWTSWKSLLGLDTMPYFQFFHPEKVLYNFEATADTVTQLAVYVVKNGFPMVPHLIWIDNVLAYTHGTLSTEHYSIPATPGYHQVTVRTASEKITLDDIYVQQGRKNMIAVNADIPGNGVTITPAGNYFNSEERNLINNTTTFLETRAYGHKVQYVQQQYKVLPVPFTNPKPGYLIGPGYTSYNYIYPHRFKDTVSLEIDTPAMLRSADIPTQPENMADRYFSGSLSHIWDYPILKGYIATTSSLLRDYRHFLEGLSINTRAVYYRFNNKLIVHHDPLTEKNIRQQFLYALRDKFFIILGDRTVHEFSDLHPQYYKLVVLMKDSGYIVHDSLEVFHGGVTVYNFVQPEILPDNDSILRLRELLNVAVAQGSDGAEFITPYDRDYRINNYYRGNTTAGDIKITGKVTDLSGRPIAGCSIAVRNGSRATISMNDGSFMMNVFQKDTLFFSFIGFETISVPIQKGKKEYNVIMNDRTFGLREVVTSSYSYRARRISFSGSVSVASAGKGRGSKKNMLKSLDDPATTNAAQQSGLALSASSQQPLILIDGVPYNGVFTDLQKAGIGTINILAKEEAMALYGSAAANGAIIVTSNGKTPLLLQKNKDDKVEEIKRNYLRHNFRDDAFWQPRLRTNAKGNATFDAVFPDDLTNWKTFAIAMTRGKRIGAATAETKAFRSIATTLALPHFLVRGDSLDILAKILNYNQDTLRINSSLTVDGTPLRNNDITLVESKLEKTAAITTTTDSMRITSRIKNENIDDGEYKAIPVIAPGTIESFGTFLPLRKDTFFTVALQDTTPARITATLSPMPVLLDEIKRLESDDRSCNEQVASKLIAMLLQKKWYKKMGKTFTNDEEIRKATTLLEEARKRDGMWGWLANQPSEFWITAHVIKALHMAAREKFTTTYNDTAISRYFVPILDSFKMSDKLTMINTLIEVDPAFEAHCYLDTISTNMVDQSDQLRLLEIKQKAGISIYTDYLLSHIEKTSYGTTYWEALSPEWYVWYSDMTTTLGAYRILRKKGGQEELLRTTRAWVLESRALDGWRNTYESANILETIGDDLLAENELEPPALFIEGQQIAKFPYDSTFTSQQIHVQKKGTRSIYFTAAQHHFNSNPQKVNGTFNVNTYFQQNNYPVSSLVAGIKTEMIVDVDVDHAAEFIAIEVPVPAGCSYDESMKSLDFSEDYFREYRYQKVNIYCRKLAVGRYRFVIHLMPRYSGRFTINPARAEELYTPLLFGREAMKKIDIGER
ncbi:alpha-2-macroglobulin family protein [Chitinophaga sp. Cy-1792]|uniref:alpha-2-macroglobulin family protein n=1 Tax=Chitinophaga sp. Cy-1792 TaxID=2608339 RepID=UPI001420B079|nr:alpha-2-macroglobulin family protein [Chitinophaga sp. Cy-1792]NIG55181.1 hypothetical protein [Chitinophaga sp. Cy-1792]